MNDRPGIVIDGEALTREIGRAKGEKCLDMSTGRIVPAAECPRDETGVGLTSLGRAKRYVRIPSVGELRERIEVILGAQESANETALYVPTSLRREIRKWLGATNAGGAEEAAARLWVASLRPPFPVGWMESDCVALVYDPERGEWR
jgi:hypothetical protein